jgi:hypothetical protein
MNERDHTPQALVKAVALLFDFELSVRDKRQLGNNLYRYLAAENRRYAEERGIGKESRLSPKPIAPDVMQRIRDLDFWNEP